MMRAAVILAAMALSPVTVQAQSAEVEMLDFVEDHCLRPYALAALNELPRGWREARAAATQAALPNLAIIEAADYAAFAAAQSGTIITDPQGRWWPLIDAAYQEELSDVRAFTRYGWYKLFVHADSGIHLMVASGQHDPEDTADDWESSSCWLWHPDADHPLNAAILDRWDISYRNRIPSHVGHMLYSFLVPVAFEGFEDEDLSMVIELAEPNRDYAPNLAAVVLMLEVTNRR